MKKFYTKLAMALLLLYFPSCKKAPEAFFTISNNGCVGPCEVEFQDQSSDDVVSLTWNFGDGNSAQNISNPKHTYSQAGDYTVTLKVENKHKDASHVEIVHIASPTPAPTVDFTYTSNNGFSVPSTITFVPVVQNATSLLWNFGDGSSPLTQTPQNVTHLYGNAGVYTVTMTATGAGGTTSSSKQITILATQTVPIAAFNVSTSQGTAPLIVTFTNTSQNATGYSWLFPGGTPSSSSATNPVVTYQSAGNYTATLTASNGSTSSTATKSIQVNGGGGTLPVASFTASPTQGAAPLTVSISNNSQNATNYTWSFPGGSPSSSSATNPTVTYQNSGNYTITLTAQNNNNQTDTYSVNIFVTNSGPTSVSLKKVTISNIPYFWDWDFWEDGTGPDLKYILWHYTGGQWESLLFGGIINANDEYGTYYWTCNIPACELYDWNSTYAISVYDDDNGTGIKITDSQYFILNNNLNQEYLNLSSGGMSIIVQLNWQ